MAQALQLIEIHVNPAKKHQAIDGWGVNINSKYWDGGRLKPLVKTLIDDLGCTLFRLDAYGKSNWVDPHDEHDASILNAETYKKVYAGTDFQNAAGMATYLNSRGIQPYICLSGVTPRWMNARDGRTLKDYASFADMAASYAHWLRKKAKIKFRLFGPLNETDIGPPEGPFIGPAEYWKAAEAMVQALDKYGLKDLKLVLPETARFGLDYFPPILKSRKLAGRVAVFGLHTYGDDFDAAPHMQAVSKAAGFMDCRFWMTEYGDLDQTGEREWYVAWAAYRRLLKLLEQGFHGALNWDAYDNYHDHDAAWSIYGLIRRGIRTDTPKKRYHSTRQMYRYVRPGWNRLKCSASHPSLTVQAYASPDGKQLTLTGMNAGSQGLYVNFKVPGPRNGFPRQARLIQTTETLDCAETAAFQTGWNEWNVPEAALLPHSIFTITTLRP